MKIFDEAQIRRAVSPSAAVTAVREAFKADGLKRTIVPSVINLALPGDVGEFHVKGAYIAGVPHVAIKVASGFPRNADRALPTGSGLMVVFSADTGLPEALLLDNGYLTDVRTGASGAIAAEVLAPRDIRTVALLGSGVQARQQVACLREVRRFERLRAWSPNAQRLARYCDEMRTAYRLDVAPAASLEDLCREADVLITTTPSRAPLVRAEWLRPGMHITAVGSDSPGKQELDPSCLSRADLVVADRLAQCTAFGELAHAPAVKAHAELGQIVAGLRPGRTDQNQITIADLTGVGFQDTAIASAALGALANQELRDKT